MKVNKKIKSDRMKMSRKNTQDNPKSYVFVMRVDVECFGYNNLIRDFKFMQN